MKQVPVNLVSLCVFVFIGTLAQSAFACTCQSESTARAGLDNYPFVAILKLEAVGGAYRPEPRSRYIPTRGQSRLSVQRVFKGQLRIGERLVFRQELSSMCGWSFAKENIGQDFLFYFSTGQEPGKKLVKPSIWSASICSRSGPLSSRLADVSYLENYEKVKGRSRVSGMVLKAVGSSWTGIAGHRLTLEGNGKKIEIATNKSGVYEIYDLEPGKYSISVDEVSGYELRDKRRYLEFDLETGGHFEKTFSFVRAY